LVLFHWYFLNNTHIREEIHSAAFMLQDEDIGYTDHMHNNNTDNIFIIIIIIIIIIMQTSWNASSRGLRPSVLIVSFLEPITVILLPWRN
jgi:hypothetical protein